VRTLNLQLDYLSLEQLIAFMEDPAGARCREMLIEHRALFESAPGSTHNHQAWPGGYIDHITDCLNYARHLYAFDRALGRAMPFSLGDALLVLFVHDLEKPWRIEVNAQGVASNRAGMATKQEFKRVREEILNRHQILLTDAQRNALTYVEGEGADYSPRHRTMNELAAFYHRVDIWSARQCHDYPRAEGDEWTGATRVRVSTQAP
jgi:hypothetical protein